MEWCWVLSGSGLVIQVLLYVFSKEKDEEAKWGIGARRGMGDRAALLAQGNCYAELSAGFPAFCLGHGASSAHILPRQALPRAPLQLGLVYVFPFSLPCTETHHAQVSKPDTTCQEMLRRWGLLPATCHSHPAFLGRALASCQATGEMLFHPFPSYMRPLVLRRTHACLPCPGELHFGTGKHWMMLHIQ